MNANVRRAAMRSDVDPDRAHPPAAARTRLQSVAGAPRGAPVVARRRWITAAKVGFMLAAVSLLAGYRLPTEQYITPQTGLGYALGITGGSLMLLLLVYPARKRVPALKIIGTTKSWFQLHMAFGVIGPLLILYHSNFRFGATNSNVALLCMLIVATSGLFGRYFYAHIHHGLHGRKATLDELRDYAERLRGLPGDAAFLPALLERIGAEERALIDRCKGVFLLARPAVGAIGALGARHRLRRYVRRELKSGRAPGTSSTHHDARMKDVAHRYIDSRLGATRRVVEFSAFERLFSLWHALHLPLFLMMLIAGTVHVVAVHVY